MFGALSLAIGLTTVLPVQVRSPYSVLASHRFTRQQTKVRSHCMLDLHACAWIMETTCRDHRVSSFSAKAEMQLTGAQLNQDPATDIGSPKGLYGIRLHLCTERLVHRTWCVLSVNKEPTRISPTTTETRLFTSLPVTTRKIRRRRWLRCLSVTEPMLTLVTIEGRLHFTWHASGECWRQFRYLRLRRLPKELRSYRSHVSF